MSKYDYKFYLEVLTMTNNVEQKLHDVISSGSWTTIDNLTSADIKRIIYCIDTGVTFDTLPDTTSTATVQGLIYFACNVRALRTYREKMAV